MSGSYDNRGRGPGGRPQSGRPSGNRGQGGPNDARGQPTLSYGNEYPPQHTGVTLDGPVTAPPADYGPPPYEVPQDHGPASVRPTEPPPELLAPPREPDHSGNLASAPIVEAGSVTGRSLTLVISIMCFLACLTAGAVYMMNQSATAWLRNMSNEITVQIEPLPNADVEQTVREVTSFLRLRRGISTVNALDTADTAKLLEPWLGNAEALADLPIPRLIAIEIDGSSPPDLVRLGAQLKEQFPNATLDDHRKWRQQINTVTRSFALGGLAILMLVAAATVAIIVSATGSAMAANRDIVEVLNFVGATDRFIAHEFEKHFLTLGIRAGLVGAGSAMLVFWLMPMVMELLGGGAVTMSELNRLIGIGSLDSLGYVLLAAVVIVIAALCMLTSRFGVYRILHHQN
ncbi:MAG: cell division transport system permease protein [Hyphomicrobiaceae bacterium]|jgi:cell division transport system permease protein